MEALVIVVAGLGVEEVVLEEEAEVVAEGVDDLGEAEAEEDEEVGW